MKRPFLLTKIGAASLLFAGGILSAGAQDASVEDSSSLELEEIIVTAQRRSQSLQEVPIAISAFTASEMDARQVTSALDVVRYVPGMTGHNNVGLGSANVYFIRGLGNTESIATFDAPVATYVDDIYVARQNANNYSLFDVERIEVLRGPQGTLFGRNTTGGAVSIVNKKPAEEFGGYFEIGAGSYDRVQARAGFDMPVSENFLTKLSAYYVDEEGWADNLTTGETNNGEESKGLRGAVTWRASDAVTWDLSLDYSDSNDVNVAASTPTLRGFDLFAREGLETPIQPNTSRIFLLNQDCDGDVVPGALAEAAATGAVVTGNCNRTESVAFTSNLEWQLSDNWSANFITGVRDLEQHFVVDFIDGAAGGFILANDGSHEQFSQEVKIAGSMAEGKLDIVAGAFYLDEDNQTRLVDFFFGALDRNIGNDLKSVAVYAQGDYHFNDQWTLTAGARWTDEEKNINYSGAVTSADIVAAGNPLKIEDDEVTPRVVLQYQATEDKGYFFSATKGFKSGGVNARGANGFEILPFRPETAWNYELGTRMEFRDNTVRVNATAFFLDVTDLQVITGIARPAPLTGIAFLTQNSADMEVKGLEIETTATITANFDVFANLGLMDAEYTRVNDVSGRITTDTTPVRAPDSQFSLGGRYTIPASNGEYFINADVSWTDEFQTATNNDFSSLSALSEGGAVFNAGIGYNTDKWSATLECKNCFEEQYVNTWFFPLYVNEPRRINARFTYRF